MKEKDRKKISESILKKAAGYESVETQEEYALVDGEMTLVKRKVTRKDVPPDVTALRILLDDAGPDDVGKEEIERERRELTEEYLRRLRETDKKEGK